MEKAYGKVWKDGLRLKLQKSGVTGCMYHWISQYLNSRKARVHVNGGYSRKKTLREGALRVAFSALPYSLSSSTTSSETCHAKSKEPYTPTILCSEEHLNCQLQTAAGAEHS